MVVDEGYGRYGVTGEIASVIAEGAFYNLEAPVKRMGAMHVPIPFSPPLEDVTVPTEQEVFEAARTLCGKGCGWMADAGTWNFAVREGEILRPGKRRRASGGQLLWMGWRELLGRGGVRWR